MKKKISIIKQRITIAIQRLHNRPPHIKIPVGTILIIIGTINIINPFINGIFIILVGSSLIGSSFRNIYKKSSTKKILQYTKDSLYYLLIIHNTKASKDTILLPKK